ncbi:MAG: (2Fe-2S) ferredoxin domain-containing protein [Magnetospirillum sp.]|nr:(2Fe-2S) ferredoxin domain-containing protein [Magnetospirillum sp.]
MSLPTDPKPYFRLHVFVCTNRRPESHRRGSCAARGSEPLRDYLKARVKELGLDGVRINSAGCLDRCELGPVLVVYPEGIWYSFHSHADIDEILETHLLKGGRVERLMLRPDDQPVIPA